MAESTTILQETQAEINYPKLFPASVAATLPDDPPADDLWTLGQGGKGTPPDAPRPVSLAVNLDGIPESMRASGRWVVWRYEQRNGAWTKVPYNANTGDRADVSKRGSWTNFPRAWSVYQNGQLVTSEQFDGVGFVFTLDDGRCGGDLDDCRDPATGILTPWATEILEKSPTYAEASPSGTGVKFFGIGQLPGGKGRNHLRPGGGRIEVYNQLKYFTVTGCRCDGAPPELRDCQRAIDFALAQIPPDDGGAKESRWADGETWSNGFSDEEVVAMLRRFKNGDKFERLYDDGNTDGYGHGNRDDQGEGNSEADMALLSRISWVTGPDPEQIKRIFYDSALGDREKVLAREDDYLDPTIAKILDGRGDDDYYGQEKFEKDFGHEQSDAAPGALHTAHPKREKERDPQIERHVREGFNDPHRLARSFRENYPCQYYRQEWWFYTGTRYFLRDVKEVRAKVTGHVRKQFEKEYPSHLACARVRHERAAAAVETKTKRKPLEFQAPTIPQVTTKLVSDVMQALTSEALINSEVEAPFMLPGYEQRTLIGLLNGLFDFDTRELLGHTPNWFSPICLPYKYDPTAACPRWVKSLCFSQEADTERISFLQEYVGYLLENNTGAHRMTLLYGEGHNGKGVFLAGVEAMLGGTQNVSHVSLENFGKEFYLHSTLGKLANICSEVGDLDKLNENVMKQYVSGDPMCFNRKNNPMVEAMPSARLLFSANKLPRFNDTTNGVWRRLTVVPFKVVVDQKDRIENMDKISWWYESGEAPGIFNWALAGLNRRRQNSGHFTVSKVCESALLGHRLSCNPARVFLTEHYEYVKEEKFFSPSKPMYSLFKTWCQDNGYHPLGVSKFGEEVGRTFAEMRDLVRQRKKGTQDEERLACKVSIEGRREPGYRYLRYVGDESPDGASHLKGKFTFELKS